MRGALPETAASTLAGVFDTLSDRLQDALGDLRKRGRLDDEAISTAMREARLALLLRKEGKQPALVAADLQRPAAIEQLEQLGRQIQVPVYRGTGDSVAVSSNGIQWARDKGLDAVILDTAGRLHVDEQLMDELAAIYSAAKPLNVLLVLDAMTGQEAVAVAQAFQERVDFDGVVLTKLDGDARGGAALSVKAVTGKPIKLVSVGEKVDQLEYFHPDRMASRI